MFYKRNTRAPIYFPSNPVINWQSPQAIGLVGLIYPVQGQQENNGWNVVGQPVFELTRGAWPDVTNSNVAHPYDAVVSDFGPIIRKPSGGGAYQAGFNLVDSLWQDDLFSLSCWYQWFTGDDNSNWRSPALGIVQGQDHAGLSIVASTGYATVTYDGSLSSVTTSGYYLAEYKTSHVVGTFDKGDLMRLYVNGVFRESNDISGAGNLDAATKRFYWNYNSHVGMGGDARYYNRVLSPDEIWQMWAPQTRWDLYKHPKSRSYPAAARLPLPVTEAWTGSNGDPWSSTRWVTSTV